MEQDNKNYLGFLDTLYEESVKVAVLLKDTLKNTLYNKITKIRNFSLETVDLNFYKIEKSRVELLKILSKLSLKNINNSKYKYKTKDDEKFDLALDELEKSLTKENSLNNLINNYKKLYEYDDIIENKTNDIDEKIINSFNYLLDRITNDDELKKIIKILNNNRLYDNNELMNLKNIFNISENDKSYQSILPIMHLIQSLDENIGLGDIEHLRDFFELDYHFNIEDIRNSKTLKFSKPDYQPEFNINDMLSLSEIIYNKDYDLIKREVNKKGYDIVAFHSNTTIDDNSLEVNIKTYSNNQAMIVKNRETKEYSFVIKGTNSLGNLVEDFKLSIASPDKYINQLIDMIKKFEVLHMNENIKFNFTGHSLGGTLAQTLAMMHPDKVNRIYNISGPGVANYTKHFAMSRGKRNKDWESSEYKIFLDLIENPTKKEELEYITDRTLIISKSVSWREKMIIPFPSDLVSEYGTHIGRKFKLNNDIMERNLISGHFLGSTIDRYNDIELLTHTQSEYMKLNEHDLMQLSMNDSEVNREAFKTIQKDNIYSHTYQDIIDNMKNKKSFIIEGSDLLGERFNNKDKNYEIDLVKELNSDKIILEINKNKYLIISNNEENPLLIIRDKYDKLINKSLIKMEKKYLLTKHIPKVLPIQKNNYIEDSNNILIDLKLTENLLIDKLEIYNTLDGEELKEQLNQDGYNSEDIIHISNEIISLIDLREPLENEDNGVKYRLIKLISHIEKEFDLEYTINSFF